MEDYLTRRNKTRLISEIFEDMRKLSQSDGALHGISRLVYRDLFVVVDRHEGCVVDKPERRWSTSKLNKNELFLLLGLMVQSPTDRTYIVPSVDDDFFASADALFSELHERLMADAIFARHSASEESVERSNLIGLLARESIYYGADSIYLHQLISFSQDRYRKDKEWLLRNVGISICSIIDITKFILNRINFQMTVIGHKLREGYELNDSHLTGSLLISKEDVRSKFGAKADAYFSMFVSPNANANKRFKSPFDINKVAIKPVINLGDYLYVPVQYRLCESIYESPFYWMMDDSEYADTHAKHRGEFLEKITVDILRSVFGAQHMHENVMITQNGRDYVGEIDVLVEYGEFVIVAQAKSKRITLEARSGNAKALEADFEGAIQKPYAQALDCINLIKGGASCIDKNGNELEIPNLSRFYPLVVLSDHFPASTSLSRAMLERDNSIAPVIWDIGVLDCTTRILPTPIELLCYLKCRSEAFDNVISDSEFNYLGYHIQNKLAFDSEIDIIELDRTHATVVDDFMIAKDVGIDPDRPIGILERHEIPVISTLIRELKSAPPMASSTVIDLYDLSSESLENLSVIILNLRKEIYETRKKIKAFSIGTVSGGFTYAVTLQRGEKEILAAEAIGARHKYDKGRDRWYVIVDSIETDLPIDHLLPLVWPWTEDENKAKMSRKVAEMFKATN